MIEFGKHKQVRLLVDYERIEDCWRSTKVFRVPRVSLGNGSDTIRSGIPTFVDKSLP